MRRAASTTPNPADHLSGSLQRPGRTSPGRRRLTGSRPQPLAVLVSAGVLTVLGVLGRDRWLTREVSSREPRMLEEFPTVAELLALAVTASEVPQDR